MVARTSKIDVTEDLWQEVVSAWLEKPSVSYVATEVGIPKALARRLIHSGASDLGHSPLIADASSNSARTNGKRKRRMAIGIETVKGTSRPSRTQQARAVIAQQEAEQYTATVKDRLEELQAEASDEAVASVLERAIQDVDGTKEGLDQAERRVALERRRTAAVTDAAIHSDRAQASAMALSTVRMLTEQCQAMNTVFSKVAQDMLTKVAGGKLTLPESLTTSDLGKFVASLDKLATATEKALRLQADLMGGDAGGDGEFGDDKPADEIRQKVSVLLEDATEEEVETILKTGALPPRLRAS